LLASLECTRQLSITSYRVDIGITLSKTKKRI